MARSRLKVAVSWVLGIAFGAIAFMWIVTELSLYMRSSEIRSRVTLITDNALESVRLVNRMGMDVERRRILVDQHIFEQQPRAMERIEAEIARTRRDYDDASREYEHLATNPTESETWKRLQADVAAVEKPTDAALSLSRANDDANARAQMAALEPDFAAIELDVDNLVALNGVVAKRAEVEISTLQERGLESRLALTLLTLATTIGLSWWATRKIASEGQRLEALTAALEEKNAELDAFSGRVAHDLRGPLGTLSLSVSTLGQRVPKDDPGLAIARRSIARMEGLIGDLLTLSRIGSEPVGASAEVAAVARSVQEDLEERVKAAHGEIDVAMETGRVRCDEGPLRQILWNLVENAVKYRREDVPVRVELHGSVQGTRYELRVSDNGAGMAAEDAGRAFEPFYRGQRTRSAPGTGLGLSIVKRFVEASHGRVSLRSVVDEGTTFVIELPLDRQGKA